MPKKKQGKEVSMRKVREILRLSLNQGLAQREVANSCNVSQSSVNKYFQQAQLARLSYEEVCGLDDLQLAKRFGIRTRSENHKVYPIPDFEYIHKEMKKKGVTLQLLWEEYKEEHPDGYQSSMFCILYRRWQKKLTPVLRQVHMAGEKLFVDYAGQTVPITNPKSGQVRQAQIFVGVLGCSNYTYAEATWTQGLEDWIASHVRCFEFMGGVPRVVVPDNLKSGVSKACFYEPEINPTYHELALHYGIAILPTRVRKPKDKAKVEAGVQVVERWILAALRNRVFFSLEELNEEIGRLLKRLNERAFKKLPGSRLTCFETLEKDALEVLPEHRFTFAQWKKAKVNIDYHVELDRHYYSVPYELLKEEVHLRFSDTTVEIFHQHQRVASHRRDKRAGRHSTLKEHMPKSHQKYLEWSPSRMIQWASTLGPRTANFIECLLAAKQYPEQGYRSCLGIMRLAKCYPKERLEAACERAALLGSYRYGSVESILKNGLDIRPIESSKSTGMFHQNIRGEQYFRKLIN